MLSLLCALTTPVRRSVKSPTFACDADAANVVCNKLLNFVVSIKSLAQTGSAFNLNCLRVVANLLHSFKTTTFALSNKYVLLCSGLGGHASVRVRLAAWSVLTGLAQTFDGAANLVSVLAKLPGGFHACCLSTFLDTQETSAVRQSAGALFVKLLQHNHPHRTLKPMSATLNCLDSQDINTTLFDLLKCHQFFAIMAGQLRHFWDDDEERDHPVATCDVVRTFCTIVTQLFAMCPTDTMSDLQTYSLVMEIFRLTPVVIVAANEASVRMLIDVCKVVAQCVKNCDQLLDAITMEEHAIVGAVVASMDPNTYGWFQLTLTL